MRFWLRWSCLEKRSQALRGRNLAIFLLAGGPVQFKRGRAHDMVWTGQAEIE